MPPGRRIPRPPDTPPERPPPPDASDAAVAPDVAKAAGELIALGAAIRACEACGCAGAERVHGTGYPRAPVMLVKDVASAQDAEAGNAFAAEADALTKAFDALHIPMGWVYGSVAVRCATPDPSPDQVRACATHLLVEIEAVQPRVVVAFGPRAVDAIRALDGRCGLKVPAEIPQGEPTAVRSDLFVIATEALPEGVSAKDSKRRLWRDLQAVGKLLA